MNKLKYPRSITAMLGIMSILVTSGCTLPTLPMPGENRFQVYFDPQFFYQIPATAAEQDFPFENGDKVILEGVMVYHGKPAWDEDSSFPAPQWSASIYPNGAYQAPETLLVQIQDNQDPDTAVEIQWLIDNDTRLFIVSDQPVPSALFPSPRNGDTARVCVTLQVDQASDDLTQGENLPIRLIPSGESAHGLVACEVWKCVP